MNGEVLNPFVDLNMIHVAEIIKETAFGMVAVIVNAKKVIETAKLSLPTN